MTKKELARQAVAALKEEYPGAVCSLEYQDPLQLLIAVRLSAQCTDARVNLVTPGLFARFPTLEAFCEGTEEEIGDLIRSCGFYNTKSKDILGMCKMIRDEFGGKVPDTIEELTRLPGVGRKTANLIVGDVYGKPAVVTDTHCIRIAGRLGLTDNTARKRWKTTCGPCCRRRNPTISATGWCSTAGLCAPPGKPIARNSAWRPSARKREWAPTGKSCPLGSRPRKNGNDALPRHPAVRSSALPS